jgi:hypothetical protein
MASAPNLRRIGAVSVTLSAGTLVFFTVGAAPASAATARSAAVNDCLPLLKPVCDVLGGSDPSTPPPPKSSGGGGSGGGTATEPTSAPKPKPKPKPAAKPPARAHHVSGGGTGAAPPPPTGNAPTIPVPQTAQAPALPNVAGQDPLVVPEAAPGGQSPSARLVADSSPDGDTIPPLLVATASGLIGAIAALNLSVLRRRRG